MRFLAVIAVLVVTHGQTFAQQTKAPEQCESTKSIVRLTVEMLSSGKIGEIKIVKPLTKELNDQAIRAAKQIKFKPEIVDGVAKDKIATIDYSFKVYFEADSPELLARAVILESPDPKFPEVGSNTKLPSMIGVKLMLNADGTIEVEEFKSDVPKKFREAATEAAMKIRFKPAVHSCGIPVPQTTYIEYPIK